VKAAANGGVVGDREVDGATVGSSDAAIDEKCLVAIAAIARYVIPDGGSFAATRWY